MDIIGVLTVIGGILGALSPFVVVYLESKNRRAVREIEQLSNYREDIREDKSELEEDVESLRAEVTELRRKYTVLEAQSLYTISYIQTIQDRVELLRARLDNEDEDVLSIIDELEEDLDVIEQKLKEKLEYVTEQVHKKNEEEKANNKEKQEKT